MTDGFVRLAGRGQRADGALVTWTMAEGRRGRRWREIVVIDGWVAHSLLYETGPDGRFTHLELAAPAGLATLHPDWDGTLHGNVVRALGQVEHVVGLAFTDDDALLVEGSPIAAAAAASVLHEREGAGVVLDPASLALEPVRVSPASLGPIDSRGVPLLERAQTWPLEVTDEG